MARGSSEPLVFVEAIYWIKYCNNKKAIIAIFKTSTIQQKYNFTSLIAKKIKLRTNTGEVMESGILKAFYLYYKDIKRIDKHFTRKAKKIEATKDSYYAYALDQWNEKDELLKCTLALEIYKWIEAIEELSDQTKKRIFLFVTYTLSNSCLREKITNHALVLTIIRSGIGDNVLEREIATDGLLTRIDAERKQSRHYLSKSPLTAHIAGHVDTIFYKIQTRLQNEEYFYISLVDGSYWHDLAEIIGETDTPISSLLTDLIAQRQNIEEKPIYDLRFDQMQYTKSSLSRLYKECVVDFVTPKETIKTFDKFGIGFAQYIEYIIFITKIQILMPSWVIFPNYLTEHHEIAFDQIYDKAPSSPLYWFCSIILESNKLLNKLGKQHTISDMYKIIKLGVIDPPQKSTHSIKFINMNLPKDTEETKLLKTEVRYFLEKKLLLNAAIEYAYYLSCLYEPIGITERRKAWFKKNINSILESYDTFLNMLRRIYVAIERREKLPKDIVQTNLDYHDQQQQEIAQQIIASHIPTDAPVYPKATQPEKSVRTWQCLDMKISIQADPENPKKITKIDKENALNQIDSYLTKYRMDSMITPRLILSTLDNYIKISDQQHRDTVKMGDLLWEKVRRGKVRLLVRPIANGLIFNVYKRQDYYHGMFK